MSQNRLGIAIVVLLALGGLTFFRMRSQRAEYAPSSQSSATLPKLKREAIDELTVSGPDQPTVHLVKKGDEWRLTEPVDAKADKDAVSTALDKLVELEVTGVAATQAKNHERLEVDDKKGLHVVVKGGGKVLLDGLIGSYQTGNTMFRLQGQAQVVSVRGSIRYAFAKAVRDFRDRTITSKLEAKDVEEIAFENKNGNLRFKHEGEHWKQVVGKGEKAIDKLDESKVLSVVNAAVALSAMDFAEPNVTPEQAGLGAGAATVTLTMKPEAKAQPLRIRIGAEKDKNYYLQREGVDTIFIVSSWVADRLLPKADAFEVKSEPAAAANSAHGAPPNMAPEGSHENPIKVYPTRVETSKKPVHAAAAKPAAVKK